MRIEYVSEITQRSGIVDLPSGQNPVRIGHDPRNDLVLDSPYVGGEAVVIDNDVAGGGGWRVWNRNGKIVRVGELTLTNRDQFTSVKKSTVAIVCWPFVLTVSFAADEFATETDDACRLDRECAALVGEVHRAVIELHPNDPPDRADWLKDTYVHKLESEIMELSGSRPDFPADDLAQTDLGNHMAGVAVKSALLNRLVAKVGSKPPSESAVWARPRIVLPDLELELERLVEATHAVLDLNSLSDLTAQVHRVDEKFWPHWNALLSRRGAVSARVCRYLARRRLVKEIKDIWFGYGPLEDLLEDPNISEIMVVDQDHIFIEKSGSVENSGRRFLTPSLTIVQRIMARANRQVNTAKPLADARMPDGSRVNAVIEPLALKGPALTIRKFPTEKVTIERLVNEYRSLTQASSDFLRAAVAHKRNIIVAGGTGSGKTTMLNCLSEFIPDKERIVTIEDTAELQLKKQHVVTMQCRQSNQEGAGSVTIRDLVSNSLRMRPDRIVIGECRGGEAIDMLQAMNTGHDGSMTTLHANTPDGVVRRLEVLVQQNADAVLPVESIHAQIGTAVHLIVQLGKVSIGGKPRKVLTEIAEVVGYEPGEGVRMVSLFARGVDGELRPTGYLPTFLADMIESGLITDAVDFLRL